MIPAAKLQSDNDHSTLNALLFTRDKRLRQVLTSLLKDFSISIEVHDDHAGAIGSILKQKHDGAFVDCDLERAPELLQNIRTSRNNRRSVRFAIVDGKVTVKSAFEMGAQFVLHKPLVTERAKQTIKAAHGLMMREKRRHFRHPAFGPLWITQSDGKCVETSLRDLSMSGLHAGTQVIFRKDEIVTFKLLLPPTGHVVKGEGCVKRTGPGFCGVQFLSLEQDSQLAIEQWMMERANEPDVAIDTSKTIITEKSSNDVAIEVGAEFPRSIRGKCQMPFSISTYCDGKRICLQGYSETMNVNGLGGHVDGELAVGQPVLIELRRPTTQELLVLRGEIRYRKQTFYGIAFLERSEVESGGLQPFMDALPAE